MTFHRLTELIVRAENARLRSGFRPDDQLALGRADRPGAIWRPECPDSLLTISSRVHGAVRGGRDRRRTGFLPDDQSD